jgi:hypothetical protein
MKTQSETRIVAHMLFTRASMEEELRDAESCRQTAGRALEKAVAKELQLAEDLEAYDALLKRSGIEVPVGAKDQPASDGAA